MPHQQTATVSDHPIGSRQHTDFTSRTSARSRYRSRHQKKSRRSRRSSPKSSLRSRRSRKTSLRSSNMSRRSRAFSAGLAPLRRFRRSSNSSLRRSLRSLNRSIRSAGINDWTFCRCELEAGLGPSQPSFVGDVVSTWHIAGLKHGSRYYRRWSYPLISVIFALSFVS